jgi:hypothetical protein
MSFPKPNNNSRDQTRELSALEVGLVSGARVLEIPIRSTSTRSSGNGGHQ